MNNSELLNSWRQASEDLKISIKVPFLLTTEDGIVIEYLMLIENFGSKQGTVILSIDNMADFNEPKKVGYYCSALNPLNYSIYNREMFIDTLTDWGFYGEASQKPTWYIGNVYE